VLAAVLTTRLANSGLYSHLAARRECGGDWSYDSACAALRVCSVAEGVLLRGGHCVPCGAYLSERR